MTVKDITSKLEDWAPLAYQESYDNCGLLVGDQNQDITDVLITLDITEPIIDDAIKKGCNLIVAHHPLIFGGIDTITPMHWVGRCIVKAIKHDICIYAIHTNLDNILSGINSRIAEKIGLTNLKILAPKSSVLSKLVTFIPHENVAEVAEALYSAGAGKVGEYDKCSFHVGGVGNFRPSESANPTIGTQGESESVNETRLEILVPAHLQSVILSALKETHPYEEVAYFISPLINDNQEVGSGIIGDLPEAIDSSIFLKDLKFSMNLQVIRHTHIYKQKVQKIAICGGSGAFLLACALRQKADVFVSADFKYHDFFETDDKLMIADIGHYESEAFTKELIYDYLRQKFANIAFHLSEVVTNPIIYT
ncbi:MAG: Nif3-like dinuclear metal center hexameric protein [Cytophagales bacterium]|nr:Nif3-like dinuclear metal center hexameric protein [Cytophagales bacterium]